MDIHIRRAQAADAGPIAEILRALGWFAHMNVEPFETTSERIASYLALCGADNSHSIYVAETDMGAVVGYTAVHWLPYLMLTGPEGYVSELFIADTARGQGIGAKLLDVVQEEARSRGCSRLSLLNLRNRESYQRNFYKNHGWIEREEVANFVLKL